MPDNSDIIRELFAKLRGFGNTFDPTNMEHGRIYHRLAGLVGYDNPELNNAVSELMRPQNDDWWR